MNNIYFENIPDIGNLRLEKILNRFENEDILFLCKDDSDNIYLCLCYEFRSSLKWIVAKSTVYDIAKLISEVIPIRSIFESSSEKIIHITYKDDYSYQRIWCRELDDAVLPKHGTYFLRTDDTILNYLYYLCFELLQPMSCVYRNSLEYSISGNVEDDISKEKKYKFQIKNIGEYTLIEAA